MHILDLSGKRLKSYKPHLASIVDIEFDETGDFVATASIDGQIYVRSLSTNEFYTFNLKRPMRTIALEPHFANRRSTRAFVAGGLAGNLIMYDKGWLGHRETIISSGEGPIWQVRWVDGTTTGSGGFIAWANDMVRRFTLSQGYAHDAQPGSQNLPPDVQNSIDLYRPSSK